jgi:hypothetical protein
MIETILLAADVLTNIALCVIVCAVLKSPAAPPGLTENECKHKNDTEKKRIISPYLPKEDEK